MAKIAYTDHARFRMEKRSISHTDVQKVLDHPESETPQGEDRKYWIRSTVDGRSLKVLVKKRQGDWVLVITACANRG
jgi:hypothetical protein